MGHPSNAADMRFEYVVVGAGPAGVQMAYQLEKAKRSYICLEAGPAACTFFSKFPRHRQLISINKRFNGFPEDEFNLRHDWNSILSDDPEMRFTKYSDKLFPPADGIVEYLNDFVKHFNLNVKYNTKVMKIGRVAGQSDIFKITSESGEVFQSKVIFMACGPMRENIPNIPGKELAETYAEHDIDQNKYANRRVCVVGGGNSGFETADHLAGHASILHVLNASPFKMAWDTHFPGNLRAINNNIIDMFHLKSLHAVRVGKITQISRRTREDGTTDLKVEYDMPLAHWDPPVMAHLHGHYDDVIFCTGWKYVVPEMYEDDTRPEITPCGKFAVLDEHWESTTKNIYFLGTCTQQRDRRAASSFIHGFRYSVRALSQLVEHERHQVPLPMKTYNQINLTELTDFLIERVSTTSALYQLNYGVLCDLLIFKPEFDEGNLENGETFKGHVEYYYELPGAWAVKQNLLKNEKHAWVVILKDSRNDFSSTQPATSFASPPNLLDANSHCTAFVRPVIRRYVMGEMVDEFVVTGNLIVRADQPTLEGDNNPVRGKNRIKNLICKQLSIKGADYDEALFTEEVYSTMFTPLSTEKLRMIRDKEIDDEAKPCHFRANVKSLKGEMMKDKMASDNGVILQSVGNGM